jgi:hypothetical protein
MLNHCDEAKSSWEKIHKDLGVDPGDDARPSGHGHPVAAIGVPGKKPWGRTGACLQACALFSEMSLQKCIHLQISVYPRPSHTHTHTHTHSNNRGPHSAVSTSRSGGEPDRNPRSSSARRSAGGGRRPFSCSRRVQGRDTDALAP